MEVDVSQKGSMQRIQIGSGFQKKCDASPLGWCATRAQLSGDCRYILAARTKEEKDQWQKCLGGRKKRKGDVVRRGSKQGASPASAVACTCMTVGARDCALRQYLAQLAMGQGIHSRCRALWKRDVD